MRGFEPHTLQQFSSGSGLLVKFTRVGKGTGNSNKHKKMTFLDNDLYLLFSALNYTVTLYTTSYISNKSIQSMLSLSCLSSLSITLQDIKTNMAFLYCFQTESDKLYVGLSGYEFESRLKRVISDLWKCKYLKNTFQLQKNCWHPDWPVTTKAEKTFPGVSDLILVLKTVPR